MGLFGLRRSRLIEVIEWTDTLTQTMVYRFPVENQRIKAGARLTVRDSQAAVVVSDGRIADVFGPGSYELSTDNLPVLAVLKSWKFGFEAPFNAEVYFVNTKPFVDEKWATSNPIQLDDEEHGVMRLRAFGTFAFRVKAAETLMKEILAANQIYDTEYIIGQLRSCLAAGFSSLLQESAIPAVNLAKHYNELSEKTIHKLQQHFDTLGLQLTAFGIDKVPLPDEIEAAIDMKSAMQVLSSLHQIARNQAAAAVEDAAAARADTSEALPAAAGTRRGAEIARAAAPEKAHPAQQLPASDGGECIHCCQPMSAAYRFCGFCGQPAKIESPDTEQACCEMCSQEIPQGAKYCPQCGAAQSAEKYCTVCGHKLTAAMKFCRECGTKAMQG